MFTLRNYTNTKCELEIAKNRLELLKNRKEELFCKYFPITPKIKDVVDFGSKNYTDKMSEYLHNLYKINHVTGKSLAEEIDYLQKNIEKLKNQLNIMSKTLHKLTGVEYMLYTSIVVDGESITQAVNIVAERINKDVSTIWKYYYPKIKKDIQKIELSKTI